MKKTTVILASLMCLHALARPAGAIERQHRPWFSHSSSPAATGGGPIIDQKPVRMDPRPATAGDDVKNRARRDDGQGRQVVQQALRYRGSRYQWGGTTKKGMDCSGLVARVWSDLKMKKIPRVSSALYNSGKPVHLADLRPGDLVFFKNTSRRGISHVGVYAGNNKFIHAANHRQGVTIAKLSDPYYQLHYAGARRLY